MTSFINTIIIPDKLATIMTMAISYVCPHLPIRQSVLLFWQL